MSDDTVNPEKETTRSLRRAIAEGCEEVADLYLEIEAEFHSVDEELHRDLD